MISQIIEIEHFKEGNRRLVAVPVFNAKLRAILYEADFDDLTELGISFKWNVYHKQVVARSNGAMCPLDV